MARIPVLVSSVNCQSSLDRVYWIYENRYNHCLRIAYIRCVCVSDNHICWQSSSLQAAWMRGKFIVNGHLQVPRRVVVLGTHWDAEITACVAEHSNISLTTVTFAWVEQPTFDSLRSLQLACSLQMSVWWQAKLIFHFILTLLCDQLWSVRSLHVFLSCVFRDAVNAAVHTYLRLYLTM